ncbi:hypothetical protein [Cecembia sp.]|uniref:hypothetical protein n=1 Tax=Cecembia sp. TaxID=1898110 RepID=UPI0025B9E1EE|nr:hypothetical protein [Cecembia sp.]
MKNQLIALCILLLGIMSCGRQESRDIDFEQWGKYWFQGKAEISSFDLVQYRYGEAREGEAVLIFVTEDFSRKHQVKLDRPEEAGRDKLSVIKMNQTRDFVTGIYPYHMMLSAFSPTKEIGYGVKFNVTSQEWCGHTFSQMNLNKGEDYKGKIYSYFEKEGDQEFSISGLPEDAIWNLIRINPNQVPIGNVRIIPSLIYQRFSHRAFKAEEAFIRILDLSDSRSRLELSYSSGERVMRIDFEKNFPYEIMAWEEIQTQKDGQQEITTAKRKAVKQIDYWKRNRLEDEFLREELYLKY